MNIDYLFSDTALPDDDEFTAFILHYQQIIALYESAIRCVTMRLDIMQKEAKASRKHNPIRSFSSRIKTPLSINQKLRRKGFQLTTRSITENLNDVAGIRIICEYVNDIYDVRDALLSDHFLGLLQEKDYIESPKPNGYRSLHLIVEVPVPFQSGIQKVKCELQLRTTAMDSWAALEHSLRYKKDSLNNPQIDDDLEYCAALLYVTDFKMQKIAQELGIFDN